MKKFFLLIHILVLLLLFEVNAVYAERPVQVIIDQKMVHLPYPLVTINGSTLFPLRFFSEKMDAQVDYLPDTNTAYIKKGDKQIQIHAISGTAYINGQGQSLNGLIKEVNGRIYVPLRFLGTALGAEITWDSEKRTITINNGDSIKNNEEVLQKERRVSWIKEFPQPIVSKPLVTGDGKIYVPNGYFLTAMDATGTVLWSQDFSLFENKKREAQKLGTPVLCDNTLYVSTSDYLEGLKFIRTFYSVDKSGKINWALDFQSNYEGSYSKIPPNVSYSGKNNQLYLRVKEGVVAYTPDPLLRYRFDSSYEVPLDPVVVDRNELNDDIVVLDRDTQGQVYLLDSEFNEEWRHPVVMGKAKEMVYDKDSRYLFIYLSENSYSKGSGVLCLDLLTKSWKYQTSFSDAEIIKMYPYKGELYLTTGKKFYRIDKNGNSNAYRDAYNNIIDFNVLSEDSLIVLYADGTLCKFNDGGVAWKVNIKDAKGFVLNPLATTAYVITGDNKMVAIDVQ
ncbi:stalk domain-containing protein [Desulforamulus putei]|uniref:stalk domain-containing protein n=1 Tax=Desulforamulus putei TaxID=74701 RepID=UPI002FDCCE0C